MEEQPYQAGDRVVIVSGEKQGTPGRIRRKKGSLDINENLWIVDYDGCRADDRNGCGYHSPHELQYIH